MNLNELTQVLILNDLDTHGNVIQLRERVLDAWQRNPEMYFPVNEETIDLTQRQTNEPSQFKREEKEQQHLLTKNTNVSSSEPSIANGTQQDRANDIPIQNQFSLIHIVSLITESNRE